MALNDKKVAKLSKPGRYGDGKGLCASDEINFVERQG
jgi:hypothetical protein